jgi:hypothetical protein
METIKTGTSGKMSQPLFKMPDLTRGLYHSNTINKSPDEVYEFAKSWDNLKNLFEDLPEELENFLDLKLSSAESVASDSYRVVFTNNPDAKIQGILTLEIFPGPAAKGAVITALGKFGHYSSKNEGPSDLINIFLKRVKAMIETKVLATTKGQPNGKKTTSDAEIKH